jgi:2-octaprenyl-6-methoxyphenol hydroxylase
VVERSDDGCVVSLRDGGIIRCRLIVAAEGRNSPLREQAGIQITELPYDQTAIVCAISHERPHRDLALEHFLPAGPVAALPIGSTLDAIPGGSRACFCNRMDGTDKGCGGVHGLGRT